MNLKVCTILLAGGVGTRMQNSIPKQFLTLHEKQIARYSFDLFLSLPCINEIVIVCDPQYRQHFDWGDSATHLTFSLPGERRQDSVYNGFLSMHSNPDLVCIHDAARPFITQNIVLKVLQSAAEHGAATAAVPMKFTIKESNPHGFVNKTLDRSKLWEIQTPQAIKPSLLKQGFTIARQKNLTVTDDVSLVELCNLPVKLVEGFYENLKITTPDDLAIAENILKKGWPKDSYGKQKHL